MNRVLIATMFLVLVVWPASAQWEQSNAYDAANCFAIVPTVDGDTVLIAGMTWIHTSTDEGLTWEVCENSPHDEIISLHYDAPWLFAGTKSLGVWRSSNAGRTWQQVSVGIDPPEVTALTSGHGRLYAGTWGGGVYISTDQGVHWRQSIQGMIFNASPDAFLWVDSVLIAGCGWDGIYRSRDFGDTWVESNVGLPDQNSQMVYDLARIPTPTGGWNVYAASYAGVQLSTDRGLSWFRAGTGMEAGSTWKLAASGTTLFVGTLWKGMYICNGLDPVWRPMGIDPVSKNGYTLGLATTPRYLLAGLNTGTFRTWRRPLDSFVTDVEESPSPASPVITSLHPNPGNAIVSMDLTLRQPGCVSVVVKDQCGRDLGVMFDDWLPVGCNVVTWSVASLPSGMYHCVLRTEQGVATRPMQVLHR